MRTWGHWARALVLTGLAPAGGLAQDQADGFLRLVHPKTFTGWDHAEMPVQGWTAGDHEFEADDQATRLLSGWTFRDFELRLGWSTTEAGELVLAFPFVHGDGEVRVTLSAGGASLQTPAGAASIHRLRPVHGMQPLVVRRIGARFLVKVREGESMEREVDPDATLGLAIATASAGCAIESPELREPVGDELFNGTDLKGWWCDGDLAAWSVADGEIQKTGKNGKYLRSETEFANFVLSFEYRLPAGANSGVGIRTPREGWPSKQGMELQLLHEPRGGADEPPLSKQSEMAIYAKVPPLRRSYVPDVWNRVVIKADGPMISAWVNGVLCQHFNTRGHEVLADRRAGWIGFQDHGAPLRVRQVRVLGLPDGSGPAEWGPHTDR